MRLIALTLPLLLSSCVALALAPPANWISAARAVADIETPALLRTLRGLADIAAAHGGNRAFGLSGYRASVDYIVAQARKHSRSIAVTVQQFDALFAIVDHISLAEVGSGSEGGVYVFGLTYSPSTPPKGITGELVLGPAGLAGCSGAGYANGTAGVAGKIVLTPRFRCPDDTTLAGRVRAAVAAGAAAVLVYNDVPTLPTAGTLGAPDPIRYRPAGFITQAAGEAWKKRLLAGETIRVAFRHLQTIKPRPTWNIIAETRCGDPRNVIAFGAHLDSVQAGPGAPPRSQSCVMAKADCVMARNQRRRFRNQLDTGAVGQRGQIRLAPEAALFLLGRRGERPARQQALRRHPPDSRTRPHPRLPQL